MAHFYTDIHEARIREVFDRIKHDIVRERAPLQAEVAVTPEPVPYDKRLSLKYRPIKQGEHWGNTWDCAWFHVTGAIPKSWKGAYVTLNLNFDGEALVFDKSGCPVIGLTNGSVFDGDYSKDHYHYIASARGGEKIELWIDVGCNGLFGVNRPADPDWEPDPGKKHGHFSSSVSHITACRFDYDLWQLRNDLNVLVALYSTLPKESGKRIRIVRAVSKALDFLPEERGGAPAVREALKKSVFAIGPDPASIHVTAIGHAHIDTAWLWPFRETVRKVGRTWASQIGLIARYPGYKFGASQAQLYKFCKENYPALYAKIQKAVAKGDWELQGGMWVEADCNIPSGESLVRQFLEGMRFFQREFGQTPRNLWIPDVFGYSGNLPQIMRVCGVSFFLTQKLSWNRYNKFPHNTFVWEGIDGSRVVTHFPPEDTYNSNLRPDLLSKHETNNSDAGLVNEAISLFGIGDGGGGPKEEFIENGLRVHALNGCPRVEFGFAQDAFDRIAKLEDELDVWSGELYFEMHRGTYTTQARQKLLNRRGEEALRVAEMLCAAAAMAAAGRKSKVEGRNLSTLQPFNPSTYPSAEFSKLWQDLLLCQFHDVIPGSSIARVYKESGELVGNVIEKSHAFAQKAGAKLLRKDADAFTLFNPSSTAYAGVVALPDGWTGAKDAAGNALRVQFADGKAFAAVSVPPAAFASFFKDAAKAAPKASAPKRAKNGAVLENDLVRYEFDKDLRLVSAFDKTAEFEFVSPAAPGNFLALYDDHPSCYDAWDIEEYASDMQVGEPADIAFTVSEGPVRSEIKATFRIGKSAFTQTISLDAGSKRLDFATDADWQETHRLLRVAFPVAVRADEASFEIQYGTLKRATHDNTKWQYAQFESCGHRYADLSDGDFGVALLNDSKYGYRVKGSVLSMSLLRAPTAPDPFADKGAQRFTYSILPHEGALADGDDVAAAAAELNQGVERFDGYAATAKSVLPVAFEGEGVELAVLKKAEEGDGLVVRLVERRGHRATGLLTTTLPNAKITPFLATELDDTGPAIAAPACLTFRPFEIKTFIIERK